jgi:adenylate cyclase
LSALLEITPETGERYEVSIGNTATIGRSAGSDIVFSGCNLVSRQHAILRCHNGCDYQIIDLGSRNGTYVDGHQVVMPAVLRDDAVITVGGNEIRFRAVTTPRFLEADDVTISAAGTISPGRTLQVAILVCDIRGFSSRSEKLPPHALAKVLGNWFRQAGNHVQQSGGTVDKFIGDAMLAYWVADHDGAREASRQALQVGEDLLATASSLQWPESGDPFEIVVALHHGPVSSGNIGLVAQRDATIIGDAVNTAFRLEDIMKKLGMKLILSDAFARHLDDMSRFEDLGERDLKGKACHVRLFGRR